MRLDLQNAAQTVRHVAEALERVLRDTPDGGRIVTLRTAITGCGVSREAFDQAVEVLVIQQRVKRAGNRLVTMQE